MNRYTPSPIVHSLTAQDYSSSGSKGLFSVPAMFALLIPAALRAHENFIVKTIGDGFLVLFVMAASFSLFFSVIRSKGLPPFVRDVALTFFIASMFYFAGTMYADNSSAAFSAAYRGGQILTVAIVVCSFYFCGLACDSVRVIDRVALVATLAVLGLATISTVGSLAFYSVRAFGVVNENAIGVLLAAYALFPLALSRGGILRWLPVLFAVAAIALTGSRTATGAIVGGIGVYACWPIIRSNRALFWATWVFVFVLAYLIIDILSDTSADWSELNTISREMTGKNLLSGRDKLWPYAINLIVLSPWFGWGAGTSISESVFSHASEHNMYLQTLLQIGFVGMAAIVLACSAVWGGLISKHDEKHARLLGVAAAVYITVMMCQNFEITLFQTNLGLSLPMWAFVGLVIGAAKPKSSAPPQLVPAPPGGRFPGRR
jgi:O-antigen ligase